MTRAHTTEAPAQPLNPGSSSLSLTTVPLPQQQHFSYRLFLALLLPHSISATSGLSSVATIFMAALPTHSHTNQKQFNKEQLIPLPTPTPTHHTSCSPVQHLRHHRSQLRGHNLHGGLLHHGRPPPPALGAAAPQGRRRQRRGGVAAGPGDAGERLDACSMGRPGMLSFWPSQLCTGKGAVPGASCCSLALSF